MLNTQQIMTYLSNNKKLILIEKNGKRPAEKNWTNSNPSLEALHSHDGNLGWLLGDDDLVIDVDLPGIKSFENLQKDLGITLTPTVDTPSGGFHCYLSIPKDSYFRHAGVKLNQTLPHYRGIDFLSKGKQCLIVGSSINGIEYKWSKGYSARDNFSQALKGFKR